jgi:nicotinamidase-related amidase
LEALLIIDMQNACIGEVPRFDLSNVLNVINSLSAKFRESGSLVVHIQHEEESGSFSKNTEGWQIYSDINVVDSDHFISKSYCDAFINTNLKALLDENHVTRLTVTGCATDFCVDSTIKGAISHGFDLVVPSDGHTTADRPHVGAKELISHFNWNWANLIIGKQTIQVVPSCDILNLTNA